MAARLIELDEETERLLAELSADYGGDISRALADLVHTREAVEALLDQQESANHERLAAQKERAERGFKQNRAISWEEATRQNGFCPFRLQIGLPRASP